MAKKKLTSKALIVNKRRFLDALHALKLHYDRLLQSYEPEVLEELTTQLNIIGQIVYEFDESIDPGSRLEPPILN